LINGRRIDWIGFLIAAGVSIAAVLYKQARGWGTDVTWLILGIFFAGLGVGQRFTVDIPWNVIAAIGVGILFLFDVFRSGRRRKKDSAADIEINPPKG